MVDLTTPMDGEVYRQYKKRWNKYKNIFSVIVLLISFFIWILCSKDSYKIVLSLISLWIFFGVWAVSRINENIVWLRVTLAFPVYFVVWSYMIVVVFLLKRKYPNSDDPEYLKKWTRRKKN